MVVCKTIRRVVVLETAVGVDSREKDPEVLRAVEKMPDRAWRIVRSTDRVMKK